MTNLSPWLTATACTGLGLLVLAALGLVALVWLTSRRERAERDRQYPPRLHDTTEAGGTRYTLARYPSQRLPMTDELRRFIAEDSWSERSEE